MNIRDFALERYLAQHEFSAPHLLCTSDCETLSINELLSLEEGSHAGFNDLRLGYTESAGSPLLRDAIADWYESVSSQEVVVTSGAEETIFITMQVLLKPGDEVITQFPCYQSLHEIPRTLGCVVRPWEMYEKDGTWHSDPEDLSELITKKTTALIINSPHNPTGYQFTSPEWQTIREIADDHGIRILSDEVYRGSEHEHGAMLPPMADCTDTGVSIGVMSKALGLAGLRIGWIASHDSNLLKRFLAFKDYTTICNSAPSEYLAAVALRQKEQILSRNLEIIQKNLKLLEKFFSNHRGMVSWSPPRAGSTAFPRLTGGGDADLFCDNVRKQAGVLLLPGSVFGMTSPHFRIGYGRKDMNQGLAQFETFLDKDGSP
ncbi:MAG TPA: aminotransferase class I/II-fold pyridoxal phosphate-dependent enzyme [Methanospirillum sp.]|nr:aminotransferase class I/II-fold pyridoxal phosphate-dependent enzyme [Methanospirillum sp.]